MTSNKRYISLMWQQRANAGCSFVGSSSPELDLLTGFYMKHPVNMQASDWPHWLMGNKSDAGLMRSTGKHRRATIQIIENGKLTDTNVSTRSLFSQPYQRRLHPVHFFWRAAPFSPLKVTHLSQLPHVRASLTEAVCVTHLPEELTFKISNFQIK